jgi:hypothetical protein
MGTWRDLGESFDTREHAEEFIRAEVPWQALPYQLDAGEWRVVFLDERDQFAPLIVDLEKPV